MTLKWGLQSTSTIPNNNIHCKSMMHGAIHQKSATTSPPPSKSIRSSSTFPTPNDDPSPARVHRLEAATPESSLLAEELKPSKSPVPSQCTSPLPDLVLHTFRPSPSPPRWSPIAGRDSPIETNLDNPSSSWTDTSSQLGLETNFCCTFALSDFCVESWEVSSLTALMDEACGALDRAMAFLTLIESFYFILLDRTSWSARMEPLVHLCIFELRVEGLWACWRPLGLMLLIELTIWAWSIWFGEETFL